MNHEAAQCPVCRSVVVSRWQHDFHECSCGAIAIDGGRAYCKLVWKEPHRPIRVTIAVESLEELLTSDGVWPAGSVEPLSYRLKEGELLPVLQADRRPASEKPIDE
jgi:hypothetical protein